MEVKNTEIIARKIASCLLLPFIQVQFYLNEVKI